MVVVRADLVGRPGGTAQTAKAISAMNRRSCWIESSGRDISRAPFGMFSRPPTVVGRRDVVDQDSSCDLGQFDGGCDEDGGEHGAFGIGADPAVQHGDVGAVGCDRFVRQIEVAIQNRGDVGRLKRVECGVPEAGARPATTV